MSNPSWRLFKLVSTPLRRHEPALSRNHQLPPLPHPSHPRTSTTPPTAPSRCGNANSPSGMATPSPVLASPKKVATTPTLPASHLIHLYTQPGLSVAKACQTLGIPSTIPACQNGKGDVLVHLTDAAAAFFLRYPAADKGFLPATPLTHFALVVHSVPKDDDAEMTIVEALEKKVDEPAAVQSARALPLRQVGAFVGSWIIILWNNKHVSRLLGDEGRLWIAPTVCARCEREKR